jgi:hypothetical protein
MLRMIAAGWCHPFDTPKNTACEHGGRRPVEIPFFIHNFVHLFKFAWPASRIDSSKTTLKFPLWVRMGSDAIWHRACHLLLSRNLLRDPLHNAAKVLRLNRRSISYRQS